MAIISLDFDGTCVTHEFPKIGSDIGAVPVLKELINIGHGLILNTMRSDDHPDKFETGLAHAIEWFREKEIPLYGIQKNPNQHTWTSSTKVHADYIIDDTAIGCPLKYDRNISESPFVDWIKMREELVKLGIL